MRRGNTPTGLAGVAPRDPIGVAVTVGIKSAMSGAPVLKDRFWLMSPQAASKEFAGSGRSYRALAREPHPAFQEWNKMAKGPGGDGKLRDPRSAVIRGNIVHARMEDCVFWNRSAQKLPEPHVNPPSQRPCCEGNGIWALRYSGNENGQETFAEIACPNEECVFAQSGLCKPFASLLFQLRWDKSDAFEGQFPATLAMWSTRGFNSARALLGLFEYVLGTKDVAPWEPEEDWKPGLAEQLGIDEPSLFGLPFTMTVGEKTTAGRDGKEGRRFPVVSFSPDGDLVQWLVNQRRQRELAGGRETLALPPATVRDPEYLEGIRHEARQELDVSAVELPPEEPARPPASSNGPILLSPPKAANLRRLADAAKIAPEALAAECGRICGSGNLEQVPAAHEQDILRYIQAQTKPGGRKR